MTAPLFFHIMSFAICIDFHSVCLTVTLFPPECKSPYATLLVSEIQWWVEGMEQSDRTQPKDNTERDTSRASNLHNKGNSVWSWTAFPSSTTKLIKADTVSDIVKCRVQAGTCTLLGFLLPGQSPFLLCRQLERSSCALQRFTVKNKLSYPPLVFVIQLIWFINSSWH